MFTRRARAIGAGTIAVAALAASLLTAGPASAVTANDDTQVCWLDADTGDFACFATQAEFEAASGARVAASRSVTLDIEPYATYYLATFYEDASYGGSSINITTSNAALCAGYHYYGAAMPSGWNDRVSSFKAYGTCKVKLYEDSGYGGSTYGPYASSSSIGSMNDEASSYQVYATS